VESKGAKGGEEGGDRGLVGKTGRGGVLKLRYEGKGGGMGLGGTGGKANG